MPIPAADLAVAAQRQLAAAHDISAYVRLIAGPGTGKSRSIEARVCDLLNQGVSPTEIAAVSFTRASVRDLRDRIRKACLNAGLTNGDSVAISTLHSLALRVLKAAGLLAAYPVDPVVLDEWEVESLFDTEFAVPSSINSKDRRKAIREFQEALWNTGVSSPVNYYPPTPPISAAEVTTFHGFHTLFSRGYACVLPGEMVQRCVENLAAGTLSLHGILNIRHLIVDEFQDLNPMDLKFVDYLLQGGAVGFVAGDDDQSLYAFRYANPSGLQNFATQHVGTSTHTLTDCFRCMPGIANAAQSLISRYPAPGRVPKTLSSLYRNCQPPAQGVVHRWSFTSAITEAATIASSCAALHAAGVALRDIFILLSKQKDLNKWICDALTAQQIAFVSPSEETYADSDDGRVALYVLRLLRNPDDYVAYRGLLCLRPGVGTTTCHKILEAIANAGINIRQVATGPLPTGVLVGRSMSAAHALQSIVAGLSRWSIGDTLAQRRADVGTEIKHYRSFIAEGSWLQFTGNLPGGMTLGEVLDYMACSNDVQRSEIMKAVRDRLGLADDAIDVAPDRVQIMTMHGAKGLTAKVVFIPALEDSVLPGEKRKKYMGLVFEAARMLYVSVTRAQAACILSFSNTRMVHGRIERQQASQYCPHLGGPFLPRSQGLDVIEAGAIAQAIAHI